MERRTVTEIAVKLFSGCAVAMVVLVSGVLLLAFLIAQDSVQYAVSAYWITTIILLASAIGSVVSMRGKTMVVAAIVFALTFWITLLAITALFFDGVYTGVPITLLLITGGSFLPTLIGKKTRKKYVSHRRHKQHR